MKRFSIANNYSINKLVSRHETKRSSLANIVTRWNVIRKTLFATAAIMLLNSVSCLAQNDAGKDAAYRKVLTERSEKIVDKLGITDSAVYRQVVDIITNQYYQLNQVQDQVKAKVKDIKLSGQPREVTDSLSKLTEQQKSSQLQQLHNSYLSKLNNYLNGEQVEKVKNGMTYNILNVTYAAYQNMILTLTETEKNKIYNWLKEARELAMDEGSSEDKHKVFGKYKGRINNYLSAEGYDMKKEEKAWQERLKQKG